MKYFKLLLCLFVFLFTIGAASAQTDGTIKIGDKVPLFVLKDQDGKTFDIKNYIGKQKLVIYFYPKDESSVCTKEACAFRDSFSQYKDAKAMVIGINSGTVESHKSFQKNHNLPFTLLSDPNNEVLKMFGVKSVMTFTGRETFVIDLSGKVVFTYTGFLKGDAHSEKVLAYLAKP
ncbi:peroxiredoxin [Pedobacter sp. L105]|uniref:peroxiredoxin n=1 Tax=Pedobacter sp. L105 TaxID=1641871 RepID=UPI00131BDD4A|nr:peroxiredoxin [Pedobacter sp. L105]